MSKPLESSMVNHLDMLEPLCGRNPIVNSQGKVYDISPPRLVHSLVLLMTCSKLGLI
jgi:hypothetical protein